MKLQWQVIRTQEALRKQAGSSLVCLDNGVSVMWALIEDLYRDYCLTSLETRRYELNH